jgi:hypothetical protein
VSLANHWFCARWFFFDRLEHSAPPALGCSPVFFHHYSPNPSDRPIKKTPTNYSIWHRRLKNVAWIMPVLASTELWECQWESYQTVRGLRES